MQLDYNKTNFTKVRVRGIECDFNGMRIDRGTVPSGLYQYEVADDDENQGDPTRIKKGIMVNFWRTLASDVPLPLGKDGVLWLDDGEFEWL